MMKGGIATPLLLTIPLTALALRLDDRTLAPPVILAMIVVGGFYCWVSRTVR